MKTALLILWCALLSACATGRRQSPASVLRDADPVLARVSEVKEFETRLHDLGATIERGASPKECIATVALPADPGYFPPRTLRVVYVITDAGLIELKSAHMTSLGSRFAAKRPNQAPTTTSVTSSAAREPRQP